MADRRSQLLKSLPTQHFVGLAEEVAAVEASGKSVIRLGQGTPDLPTPAPICEALERAITDPATPIRSVSRTDPLERGGRIILLS